MTTLQSSPHNPFRSNQQTPVNTGSQAPSSPPPPPFSDTPSTAPSASAVSDTAPQSNGHTSDPPAQSSQSNNRAQNPDTDDFGLDTELPPAYTPAADTYHGEATIEYGPVRPFQRPPPAPRIQPHLVPQPTGQSVASSTSWSQTPNVTSTPSRRARGPISLLSDLAGELERQLTITAREISRPTTYRQTGYSSTPPLQPSNTGRSWNAYPGQQQSYQRPSHGPVTPNHTGYRPPPPPRHPSEQLHARSVSSPATSPTIRSPPAPGSATSDFARDFYAAGADASVVTEPTGNININASHSTPNLQSSPGAYQPPPGPPPGRSGLYPPPSGPLPNSPRQYAPPSGPPPPLPQRPRTTSPTPGSSSGSGSRPNDGRPTQVPTPGHPLMRDGKVLVYPNGYVCDKCNNTGFKHSDPLNPCKKCWQKFAKLFSGPLTWASWGADEGTSDSTLRRSATSAVPRQKKNATHSTTLQRPLPNFTSPRARSSYPEPQGPSMSSGGPYINAPQNIVPAQVYSTFPSSSHHQGNTLAVLPGDPRIGGQLCWNCSGRGLKSVLGGLLGEEECFVCKGVGRVF
ncbi:GATA-type domain-containing protein [Pleurotus pulmonarius]|nr:hypothetical protein EYR36_000977 [Pleurotus pulmonarius]